VKVDRLHLVEQLHSEHVVLERIRFRQL
jgi:hypothetical protein